jgi:AcrR family transcriptional regulator
MKMSLLHRKERLVITTVEVIDELGIQRLSTREIAKRQGVSEATLFKHFKSKNELLLAVLEHFCKFDADIFQSTRLKKLRSKEAIIYMINSFVEYYESYPAVTSIIQVFDVLRSDPELADRAKIIYEKRTNYIKQLLEDAQKACEIPSTIDIDSLSYIILGFCREICLKWRFDGRSFSLRDKTLSTLRLILDAFY